MIVIFFWGLGNWDMIILSVFGVLFSGIYILIDLLKLMTPEVCSYDDYILGSLMLYLDMVRMFIYILRIFA